jgi:pimeloyl-ACP methyl ester carboxylesterase
MPTGPVLLLHGSGPGTTGAAWTPLIAALRARGFECVAPDLPGFGSAPAAPVEEWASLLAPAEPCAVVGNSAGGALALKLAALGLATKVVAVGSMGHPMALPAGLDEHWSAEPTAAWARRLLDLWFFSPPGEDAVRVRLEQRRAHPGFGSLFPEPRQRWVDALSLGEDELDAITAPVLLIHGANDPIVPLADSALPLLERLHDVRAHIFGHCGHASPIEYTDEFNRLVLTFLET